MCLQALSVSEEKQLQTAHLVTGKQKCRTHESGCFSAAQLWLLFLPCRPTTRSHSAKLTCYLSSAGDLCTGRRDARNALKSDLNKNTELCLACLALLYKELHILIQPSLQFDTVTAKQLLIDFLLQL